MKRVVFILTFISILASNLYGGAIGLQLGKVTFGLGGSSNGPIIGIGPSPDNGLPISVGIVPAGDCCGCQRECNSCD
jgi:hypothetical protein